MTPHRPLTLLWTSRHSGSFNLHHKLWNTVLCLFTSKNKQTSSSAQICCLGKPMNFQSVFFSGKRNMAAVTPVSNARQEVLVLAPKELRTVWKKRVSSSVMCLQPNGTRVTVNFGCILVFLPQESPNTLLCIHANFSKPSVGWSWGTLEPGLFALMASAQQILCALFRGAVVTQQLRSNVQEAVCNNITTVSHYHPNNARIWWASVASPLNTYVHSF